MSDQERQQQANALIQQTLRVVSEQYGFTLEAALQPEMVTDNYVNLKAVVVLKAVPGWSILPDTDGKNLAHPVHTG